MRSLRAWGYVANYLVLGAAALVILLEIIDSGVWRRLGVPLLLIALAIGDLARMHAAERKRAEPSARLCQNERCRAIESSLREHRQFARLEGLFCVIDRDRLSTAWSGIRVGDVRFSKAKNG